MSSTVNQTNSSSSTINIVDIASTNNTNDTLPSKPQNDTVVTTAPTEDEAAPEDESTTTTATPTVLSSLPEIHARRTRATNVTRVGNVDVIYDDNDDAPWVLCPLAAILPFWITEPQDFPFLLSFQDTATMALAAQHLNTGDGSVLPVLEGLNDRCPVRFTLQAADTNYLDHVGLQRVLDLTRNTENDPNKIIPCAFIGAYRSLTNIPMATVTGVLGYPQISPTSSSTNLDDKNLYPLFGRTTPSDRGNTVPLLLFMRDFFQLEHLAVINVNDAFGNAFVDGLRQAAATHAPDLKIHQVPFDADETQTSGFVEDVVASVKASGYRFVFVLVFDRPNQDRLMREAESQGIAGDGMHQWIFGISFQELEGQSYEKDGPLHRAYRGVSNIQVLAGTNGDPAYDRFVEAQAGLANDADRAYLDTLYPVDYNDDGSVKTPYFRPDPTFPGRFGEFGAFSYEAVVALGLAACDVVTEQLAADQQITSFSGAEHFAAFRRQAFAGASGDVAFDPLTGTREPSGAMYTVLNYVPGPDTEDGRATFQPVATHIYRQSEWHQNTDYFFSDGTSNVPPDVAPVEVLSDGGLGWLPLGLGAVAVLWVFGLILFLIREYKRKSNDAVWRVKPHELTFGNPPEVLGNGTFGLVLLAEYRGTQVAVKRVIPSHDKRKKSNQQASMFDHGSRRPSGGDGGSSTRTAAAHLFEDTDPSTSSLGATGGMVSIDITSSSVGMMSHSGMASKSMQGGGGRGWKAISKTAQRKMKEEFMEEMRYLSRLRHPCVTTVMGAVLDQRQDPMLVMELMEHGSLYDLLHNETMALDGEILLPILRDISQGMRFLHSAEPQVLHGDLKAANVLVDKRFRAKVADFGLSQKKHLGGTGTPFWMAPELLRKESTNTSATDVFSFGVILYEVFSRKDPYPGENAAEVLELVADPKVRKRVAVPTTMPDELKTLLNDCLLEDPSQRPTFQEMDVRLKRLDDNNVVVTTKKKSHVSLFDIFPQHVAEALQEGRKVEAEHKEIVTIFFSDIVGFTNISATLDPRKVANMLDRLYHKFDDLSTQHDIYKVETIGDAFMAVANLVKDQPEDHCKRIAEFSIAAVQAANETMVDEEDPSKGYVNIRVGFHSGSVVADVVGNRNPRYCLFGDAVNTASRMESNSAKNRINCSRPAAKVLRQQWPQIPLKSRGELNIKGKGRMVCYWVNEGSMEQSSDWSCFDSGRINQEIADLEADLYDKRNPKSPPSPRTKPKWLPRSNQPSRRSVKYGNGDMAGKLWEDGPSEDFSDLEGNLKNRLSRLIKPESARSITSR